MHEHMTVGGHSDCWRTKEHIELKGYEWYGCIKPKIRGKLPTMYCTHLWGSMGQLTKLPHTSCEVSLSPSSSGPLSNLPSIKVPSSLISSYSSLISSCPSSLSHLEIMSIPSSVMSWSSKSHNALSHSESGTSSVASLPLIASTKLRG